MTLFARHAQIPLLPHLGAVARRVAEEAAARVLRGRRPELVAAWRGWRDGRRGRGGKPAS
jgi:N-acetylglucosaminyl-diphospho-decaprenol L-rhamnosyltransferase